MDEEGRECSVCGVYKPWDDFYKSTSIRTGYRPDCRECGKEAARAQRRRSDPVEKAIILARDSELRIKRREKLAGTPRAESCEICGQKVTTVYDHDHGTGVFRGWLCSSCNSGLGFFKDSIQSLSSAIKYLCKTSLGKDGIK